MDGNTFSPSFSQVKRRGKSPCDTPQTVRVRIFSAKSILNAKGSITGGTEFNIERGVFVCFGFKYFFYKELRKRKSFEPKKKRE